MKNRPLLLTLLAACLLGSCDLYKQDTFEPEVFVESYLVAEAPLPHVRVSTTLPADVAYSFERAALDGANVEIQRLDDNNQPVSFYTYHRNVKGIYLPDDRTIRVQPNTTYHLRVTFDNRPDIVTATTFVPDTFQTLNTIQDTTVYQSSEQLRIQTTLSRYPGRQNIYIFNIISLNPRVENLTPFYADIAGDEKQDAIDDFSNNSSGIINQDNYKVDNGTITFRFPWIGFAFYGSNKIVINAIDDNVYDFVRSQGVQTGGSTLSPGEIQNVIYNVEGGIGIFGSMAADTVQTYLKPNPRIQP